MIIEQFLPSFHYGDAIGNSVMNLHHFFLSKGIESRIIAFTIDDCLKDNITGTTLFNDYSELPKTETQVSLKILHFAVPSPLTDFFLNLNNSKGKKIMIYHNITPSHFFADYSDALTRMTHEGRIHLERLNGCFDLSIADSSYNADELRTLNYSDVHVYPLPVNLNDYDLPYSRGYYELIKDERKNIVFVGRISPNKKIEDLIRLAAFYKNYISASIRLIIAGNINTLPPYFHAVHDLALRLKLNSDDLMFTGHIPFEELLAVYRIGDVFLSMSEHEGFCLPLIESCYHQLPVVAFNAGAVAETLGGSGIIFNEKKLDTVAGIVEQVIHDENLRTKLKSLQTERIDSYRAESNPENLLALLKNA